MALLIRALIAVSLVMVMGLGAPGIAARQSTSLSEADAKATFLYNLALFAHWPTAEARARAPFSICVLGPTPVSRALRGYQRQVVHGRSIAVRELREGETTGQCEILFIPAGDPRRLASTLAPLASAPVVTVGEADGFLQAGGMLRVTVDQSRLRFDVELAPAERAGIKFSSRLLVVAATVRRHGDLVRR